MGSIIDTFVGEFEIIPVLDGAEVELLEHPSIKPLILPNRIGMRGAINAGVKKAAGEYLMRTDAHCMFGYEFDEIILRTIQPNWIVDAKRYFLNPETWTVMDTPPVEMERLIISGNHHKFASHTWPEMDDERLLKPKMAMQGSVWVMPHSWWDSVIGELQEEGYGTLYQDSTEMTMKTWRAGGELMLNTETWYAHKHRDFNRTHDYPNELSRKSWDYAREQWEPYYRNEVLPRWKRLSSI